MKKYFVLDTNVLIHSPQSIYSFEDNVVVIPIRVIEELDRMKKYHDEKGRHAREVVREIDKHRGSLGEGSPLPNGGSLMIMLTPRDKMPAGLDTHKLDNEIILTAYHLTNEGKKTIFVSKDLNARIKADALGIITEDYEKQKIDFEEIYTGYREIEVDDSIIDRFYADRGIDLKGILGENWEFYPNEFITLKSNISESKTALTRYDYKMHRLIPLVNQNPVCWGIKPLNREQRFAFDILLDDNINLVTLIGPAGTGKTLIAIASGLVKVMDEGFYRKMLVSRPVIPMGQDIGFLPGSKEEKLSHWMRPIFDNIEFIFSHRSFGDGDKGISAEGNIRYLKELGKLEIEALTYIRGRSLPKMFLIIDEAQNLTPHEVKTVISRCGEGTKIILTGDPYQIDNPYLDANSNGLSYAVERFKGQEIFGHVYLKKSERSKLASIAAQIL